MTGGSAPQQSGGLAGGWSMSGSDVYKIGGNVGLGTSSIAAGVSIDMSQRTDSIILPKGTTGQQPGVGIAGMLRYNTTSNQFEGYTGSAWGSFAQGSATQWTTTGSDIYHSTGNVGIGNSSPQARLQVTDTTAGGTVIKAQGTSGFTMLADAYSTTESQGNIGITYSEQGMALGWNVKPKDTATSYVSSQATYASKPVAIELGGAGTDIALRVLANDTSSARTVGSDVAMAELVRVTSAGNVGIGTTGPAQKLHVASSSGTARIQITDHKGSGGAGASVAGIGFGVNDGSHNIGTGDTAAIVARADSGTYGALDFFAYNQGSTAIMTILGNGGKVGIGSASPGYKLDVAGDIKTTGQIYGAGSASTYGALSVNGTKSGWGGINFRSSSSNYGTLMVHPDYQGFYNDADNGWDWYFTNGTLTAGTIPAANVSAGTFPGSFTFSTDARAPIFYDSNNTGFYLDPASISVLNDIRPSIIYDRDNTGYYVDPHSISIVNQLRAAFIYDQDNTGYYLDPSSVSNVNRIDAQDMRSAIFYDAQNTGYYVDPNSTSNIYTMQMGGYLGVNVAPNGSFRIYAEGGAVHGILGRSSGVGTFGIIGYGDSSNAMGALLQNTSSGRYCYIGTWSVAISCSDTVSDIRLKKDVTALKPEEGLAAVMHLRPVHYRWIDERLNESGSDTEIGFIAQEVEKVLPLLVYETPQAPDAAVKLPGNKSKALFYQRFVVPLVLAVQQMKIQLDQLAADIPVKIAETLKEFGIEFMKGVTRIASLIADHLTVGSAERPSGITLYDEDTKAPYCLKMKGGKMVSVAGACAALAVSQAEAGAR